MSLQGAIAEAVRQGKEVVCAEGAAITATLAITTPFRYIDGVVVTHNASSAPGLGSCHFTYEFSNNVVTIYAWKPTGAGDCTLIAGTVATAISYVIIGRRDR